MEGDSFRKPASPEGNKQVGFGKAPTAILSDFMECRFLSTATSEYLHTHTHTLL